jgi:hypothetical protein
VADGVAVGAQGARRGVDLLDAAVPQVAAFIGYAVIVQLVDSHLHPERVALGRQPPALEGVEDRVRVGLEQRELLVGALGHRALALTIARSEDGEVEQFDQASRLRALPQWRHAAALQLGVPPRQRRANGDDELAE